MKTTLLMALTLVNSVVFATAISAQAVAGSAAVVPGKAHAVSPAKKPVFERKAPEKKGAKPKTHQYKGDVTKIDTMEKIAVVKGSKGEMTFDMGTAKTTGNVREGDKVTVKYTEKEGKLIASAITKATEKKETKKEMRPDAKPIEPARAKK